MEEYLKKLDKTIKSFNTKGERQKILSTRSVLSAFKNIVEELKKTEKEDKGNYQPMARQLTEKMAVLPMLNSYLSDETLLAKLHTRKLAEDHINTIENLLMTYLKEAEAKLKEQRLVWLTKHPVLGPLREKFGTKSLAKQWSDKSYLLLFRENINKVPEIIVRAGKEGRVYTRFRPIEFTDAHRIYKQFHGKSKLVGAAFILDNKLEASFGKLPAFEDGQDQLKVITALSKAAVGRPALAFIENNPVLLELHNLAKSKSFDKDSYILLFTRGNSSELPLLPNLEESNITVSKNSLIDNSKENSSAQNTTIDENLSEPLLEAKDNCDDELLYIQLEEEKEEGDGDEIEVSDSEILDNARESNIETTASDESSESIAEEIDADEESSVISENCNEESSVISESCNDENSQLCLLLKHSLDGKIITRYRSFEFSDARKLFDNFCKREKVVGAAVIKDRELIQTIGAIPKDEQGTISLQFLVALSREAMDKPNLEFVNKHEVFSGLHNLLNNEPSLQDAEVLLFVDLAENGRPELLSISRSKGPGRRKFFLTDFRLPRHISLQFQKFADNIVGASVLVDRNLKHAPGNLSEKNDLTKSKHETYKRTQVKLRSQQVVVAAFGKTPLKQNILLTPEILKRLGVDLS